MTDETSKPPSDALALVALPGSRIRLCGDDGGRGKGGGPCAQPVFNGRLRCAWHPRAVDGDPEASAAHRSAFAAEGREAQRTKRSPQIRRSGDPRFTAPTDVLRWCEATAGAVRRGEHKDYKALDAELRVVRLALDALGVQALDSLAELEQLVRGRLQAGAA
jgi:hypothetical protein